jgi:Protein of unknown function (DUF3592)
MSVNGLIFGGFLFVFLGVGLFLYVVRSMFEYQKLQQVLISVPAKNIDVWLTSVQKGSRFPRTEFSPVIQYQYVVKDCNYSGNKLYINGDLSYERKKDAEEEVERLKRLALIYCDPSCPERSFASPNISSSLRAHLNGLLGSGVVLCITGLMLLWAGV